MLVHGTLFNKVHCREYGGTIWKKECQVLILHSKHNDSFVITGMHKLVSTRT